MEELMPRVSLPSLMLPLILALVNLDARPAHADDPPGPTVQPLFRAVDLNIGESREVELCDAQKATVKLLGLHERRDPLRNAIRRAEVQVEVNGRELTLVSGNYRLPVTVAGVQIDCPVTAGYRRNSEKDERNRDPWGLDRDVRLRLWPAGSPWIRAGTFRYPVRQRWFASGTQMANEPVHVDGGENPHVKQIYYHFGLDMGGAEGLVEVVSATDGLVVAAGREALPGYESTPVAPRYDVVYVLDGRGWYCRYSHLHSIRPEIKPGVRLRLGQPIGILGKEGGSGGWSHLHFDITGRQPSGKWGIVEGYAFLWEAYLQEHQPKVLAVARPHQLALVGQRVILDGSRSWAASGKIASCSWTFTDGETASGAKAEHTYSKPGVYSEILKVADEAGHVDFDFAVVNVLDAEHPDPLPPTIHAAYYPTLDLKPGHPVTFLVRTFRATDGDETWDFGDGSPSQKVHSDGNVKPLARDGYARTVHQYKQPGNYLVRVERTNSSGYTATARLHVEVGPAGSSEPAAGASGSDHPLRAGIIGLDTSHVVAFTRIFNDPRATGDVAGVKIVAGFPAGTDIPDSRNRVQAFTRSLRDMGVEIVDSIPALLAKVDVVLLESVDGRPHLEQVLPVLKAGKPVFVDKPLAGSLKDAVAIYEAARSYGVPIFSSSSLRFSRGPQAIRQGAIGDVLGCATYGPCPLEPHHPDLFWYGIHGVESLFTCMGPGCRTVTRTSTPDCDMAVGVWRDGRIGSFRGLRKGKKDYGGTAFGSRAIKELGNADPYEPLVTEIARFFRTRKPPVSAEETLEIYAFMEAADESKRQGGAPVALETVLARAR
jgi:PKD domain/Peptidase family M23/Oxidoreductase family, NAD-binding Rossmann fold